MKARVHMVACLSLVAIAAATSTAAKATVLQLNGSNACTPVLDVYSSALVKRAVGLYNASTTPVFVTCALQTVAQHVPPNDSQHFSPIRISFVNRSLRAATLNCTVVVMISGDAVYYAAHATAAIGAGGVLTVNTESGRFSEDSFAVTCKLPSQVELSQISSVMTEFEFVPMQ